MELQGQQHSATSKLHKEQMNQDEDQEDAFETLPGYVLLPCNQCIFFTNPVGCQKGDSCVFCHHSVPNGSELEATRPKKHERQRLKAEISQLVQQLTTEQQPQAVHQLQMIAQKSKFARITCTYQVKSLLQIEAGKGGTPQPPTGRCRGIRCFRFDKWSAAPDTDTIRYWYSSV